MMRVLGHDLHALFPVTGSGDLLETELLQGITQEQAARHLIVDDQNFDFFGDGHYSLPSLRSAAAFRTSSPMEPRGSWVSTAPNS